MQRFPLFLALGALVAVLSPAAVAQCNGYDQFQTGSPTQFDLSGIHLTGDTGPVNFQGSPFDSSFGNADTIIKRSPDPNGNPNLCILSVYALNLKSIGTVNYTDPTTGTVTQVDVTATINNTGGPLPSQPDPLTSQSNGTLNITSSGSTGGTFDSTLFIYADIVAVETANPSHVLVSQQFPDSGQKGKTLVATEIQWHTTPPSGYPTCLAADVFYVYDISGAGHPHVVKAATTTCGGAAPAARSKGNAATGPSLCICKVAVQ